MVAFKEFSIISNESLFHCNDVANLRGIRSFLLGFIEEICSKRDKKNKKNHFKTQTFQTKRKIPLGYQCSESALKQTNDGMHSTLFARMHCTKKKTTKTKQTKPSRKSICSQVIHARCSESAKVGNFFFIAKSYFPFTVIVLIMRREEREKKKTNEYGCQANRIGTILCTGENNLIIAHLDRFRHKIRI